MTASEAAWVREHVWTQRMRDHQERIVTVDLSTCACEWGLCRACRRGLHNCMHGKPLRQYETIAANRSGVDSMPFREPYEHLVDVVPAGPMEWRLPFVWLADRVCVWVCPCPPCRAAQESPERPAAYERVALFDLAGATT